MEQQFREQQQFQQRENRDVMYEDEKNKQDDNDREEYTDDSHSEYSDDRSEYSKESSRNSEYDKDEIVPQKKENDEEKPSDIIDGFPTNEGNEDEGEDEDKDKELNGSFIEEISDQEYKKGKYENLSVNQLKDKCKELQLPISGNKTKLVERLINY